jgi:hypothetical protein
MLGTAETVEIMMVRLMSLVTKAVWPKAAQMRVGLIEGIDVGFRSNATSLSLSSSTSQRCFRVFSCWLAEDGEGAGDGDGEGGEWLVLVVVADVVL